VTTAVVTTAVVFVPAGQVVAYLDLCLTYCAARGYAVTGVVTSDLATAAAMLFDRLAGVLVVARLDHLVGDPCRSPDSREPRVEVAGEITISRPRNELRPRPRRV